MSELDEAVTALEQAVARLEALPPPAPPQAAGEPTVATDPRVAAIAAALATRVDAALAQLDRILAEEG